jgi:hypothetical protein
MLDTIKIIVFSAGFSAVFSGAIIWLFKSWISERLKNAIAYEYAEKLKAVEHEYNQQLEKLRAQLQSESFKAKEEMEHDRKIFERLVSYCDEITFRDVCQTIAGHQFFDDEKYKHVHDLEHYGIQDENQFVNQDLRAAFLKFHKSLAEFTAVVGVNFFNTTGNRYMLYPECKNSGIADERKMYEEAREETRKAGIEILDAFSNYRQVVKQKLYV